DLAAKVEFKNRLAFCPGKLIPEKENLGISNNPRIKNLAFLDHLFPKRAKGNQRLEIKKVKLISTAAARLG
ncbi:MAG: hypothetical protein L6428_12920, partial [Candidatus Aminicenantes bacterium]|nr:hypothetical protein [Candidatus Aminicenantes bacterium]